VDDACSTKMQLQSVECHLYSYAATEQISQLSVRDLIRKGSKGMTGKSGLNRVRIEIT
jgi:hypothetical protein